MNYLKNGSKAAFMAFAFTLATAGLMACGSDSDSDLANSPASSSSNSSESSTGKSSGTETEKIQQVIADIQGQFAGLGECSERLEGSTKNIATDGRNFKVQCHDGGWESHELEKYMETLQAQLVKDKIDGSGCNFSENDKIWKYSITIREGGDEVVEKVSFNTESGVKTKHTTSSGAWAELGCKYADDLNENRYCENGKMHEVYTDTIDMKSCSRKELFNDFMKGCLRANGIYDRDDFYEDEIGISSGIEEAKSSSDAVSICNFKKSDDEWIMEVDELKIIYEWEGTVLNIYQEMTLELSSAEDCKEAVPMYKSIGIEGACDGAVFKSRFSEETKENADRNNEYAVAKEYCDY